MSIEPTGSPEFFNNNTRKEDPTTPNTTQPFRLLPNLLHNIDPCRCLASAANCQRTQPIQ